MGHQTNHANLSARGSRLIVEAGHSGFHNVTGDIYRPGENPGGILSLGLAENTLMHDELIEFINKSFELSSFNLTYGDGSHGSKRLRAAISRFVNRHFHPYLPVKSDHIRACVGVSCASELLALTLANEEDGFLIGRPHYGAFIGDFWAKAKVRTVGVAFGTTDPFSFEAVAKYEEKLLRSNEDGVPIKALVLCTPNNPLGQCYSREVIIALMKLCQKHRIHLISDEIYALSVWENEEAPSAAAFTSVLSIDTADIIDPSLVHVMWGMSKDFGANGLRLGCVIDQHNPELREALRQISLASFPPAPSDTIAATILENDCFTDAYICQNQARLAESYVYARNWLTEQRITYAPGSNSGFFLWVNLGAAVSKADEDYDHDLLKNLFTTEKLLVADALGFAGEEVGWFRIIFTHPKEYMDLCFGRMEKVLQAYRSARDGTA
ncbi:uncharacterized protein K452DRAFT_269886 [Aplosporella prunicola CBS 121167]|uniref:Aminotransferase class I/classII large domain-containing protein n=1 Tax=Aplosporella prunicola CBS 121167 TaxID=1176127 RepID=A0A6A6BGC6_9PEZI|nr:uncharacterized protein K452DRAFT_269886 [Aplosporella prunicola CBS 121167]KAF2142314.1 hypothetical protein K452DRAFT_269886 [Aplosporella prunicola CBS 121167]